MNSICVFCGSSTGFGEKYKEGAISLGAEMASRGLHLIYGGGNVGLMGLLAQTVLEGGVRVTGIIPDAIHRKVMPLQGGQTIVVADMHSRKMKMHEESDGFIALPGGIGTFEEILEAFTWSQLGFHKKPVALLNTEGYYQSLLDQFAHSVQEGFLKESHNKTLLIDDDPSTLLDAMDLYKPLTEDKWITR